MGIYSWSDCVLAHTREKIDLWNSFTAGSIAGAAVSATTRIPNVMIKNALMCGMATTIYQLINDTIMK